MFSRTLAIGSGGGCKYTKRPDTQIDARVRACELADSNKRGFCTHSTCRLVLPHHYGGEGG